LKITRTDISRREMIYMAASRVWVSELRRCWKKTHRTDNKLKCIVDLNDVTSIDEKVRGSCEHVKRGVQFIARYLHQDLLREVER